MATVRDVRDLEVWQVAMEVVLAVYGLAKQLPASERFELASQMRRAAVSVPSNIAEGYGRRSRGDYARFLAVANGSVKEVETQVLVATRLGDVSEDASAGVLSLCRRVSSMLTVLHRRLSA